MTALLPPLGGVFTIHFYSAVCMHHSSFSLYTFGNLRRCLLFKLQSIRIQDIMQFILHVSKVEPWYIGKNLNGLCLRLDSWRRKSCPKVLLDADIGDVGGSDHSLRRSFSIVTRSSALLFQFTVCSFCINTINTRLFLMLGGMINQHSSRMAPIISCW
ncbi:hypothetical protein BDR05DRAFT_542146 [Suillus weaverae]|nr:hypothetical protein BDR05DRAFT_542146 [Suillus weaverae]